MKKLKLTRTKKVLLSAIALVLVAGIALACFGDFFKVKAAIDNSSDGYSDVYFNVPEVIYLVPGGTTYQYVCDQTLDTSKTDPITPNSTAIDIKGNTSTSKGGNVNFYCATASNISITASGSSYTQSPVLASSTASGNSLDTKLYKGTAGSNANDYIIWKAQYTDSTDGLTKCVEAITYVYAPYTSPVFAATRNYNDRGVESDLQSIAWIAGIHGMTTTGSRGIVSSSFNPIAGTLPSFSQTNNSGGRSQDPDPSDYSGSSSTPKTGNFQNYTANADNNNTSAQCVSPNGYLYVDRSRFSNFQQIPNLKIGFTISYVNEGSSAQKNRWFGYYLSDFSSTYTTSFTSYYSNDKVPYTDNRGTYILSDTAYEEDNVPSREYCRPRNVYNGTWDHSVANSNGYVAIKGAARFGTTKKSNSRNSSADNSNIVVVDYKQYDKSGLRKAIANATKEFARFGVSSISNNKPVSSVFSSSDSDWTAFQTAYYNAATALTKVNASVDTSYAGTLNSAVAALKVKQGTASAQYYSYDPSAGQTTANAVSIPTDVFPRDNDRDSKTYTIGDTVWATAETISGYDFTGEVDVIGTYSSLQNITNGKKAKYVTSDTIVFRFYYKPKSSVASFNANGGTGGPTAKTIKVGASMPSISTELPTKTGYGFDGYWDAATGGTRYYNNNGSSAHNWDKQSDTILYAHWTPNTYTVAYNGNVYTGGSTTSSSHTYDVSKNLTANGFERKYIVTFKYQDSTLAKEGSNTENWNTADTSLTATYSFKNWNTASGGTGTTYTNQQSVKNLTSTAGATVTLYAQWNTGSVTLPDPGSRPGYTFQGWYDSASGGTKIGDAGASYTPSGAKTLYAHWSSPATYTVSFNGNKPSGASNNLGGTVSGNITATFGAKPATLSGVPTLKGWTFNGYYTATSGGTKVFNSDGTAAVRWYWCEGKTLYAQWTANTYTVSYNGNGSTSGSTASSSHTYDTAKNITSNGFTKRNTATFYPEGTSASPAKVESSASNNATVTKNVDWTFVNWTASGVDSQGTQSPYTNGQSVKNLTATNGATITLNAQWTSNKLLFPTPTRDGYAFDGWYENNSFTGTKYNANTEYTVDSNKNFYAHWISNKYEIKYVDTRSTVADQISFNLAADGTVTFNGVSSTSVSQYILWPLDVGHSYTIQIEKVSGTFSKTGSACIVAEPTNSGGTAPSTRLNVETSTGESTGTKTFTSTSGSTDYIKVWFWSSGESSVATATDYKCKIKLVDNTTGKTYYVGQTQEAVDVNVGNLPKPTRPGYTFDGWYTATSGGNKLTETSVNLTRTNNGSVTYYAHWTAISGYIVTFDEQNDVQNNIFNYGDYKKKNDVEVWFTAGTDSTSVRIKSDGGADDENNDIKAFYFTNKYVNSSGTAVNNAGDYIFKYSYSSGSINDANLGSANGYAQFDFIQGNGNGLSTPKYRMGTGQANSADDYFVLDSSCTFVNIWVYAKQGAFSANVTEFANYTFNVSMVHGMKNVTFGSTPKTVNVPVYTGYEFRGYYTKPNGAGTKVYNANGTPVGVWNVEKSDKNVTLYAYWVPVSYMLDVNWDYTSSAGTSSVNDAKESGYAQVTVTDNKGFLTSNNTNVGDFYQAFPNTYVWTMSASVLDSNKYTFRKAAGGYGATETRSATMTSSDHGETFHIEPVYKIAFNVNDVSVNSDPTGSMSTTRFIAYSESFNLPSVGFTLPGYTFTGWNTKSNGTGTPFANGANVANTFTGEAGKTITLYAQWSQNTYTVTFDEQNGIPYNIFDAIPSEKRSQTSWGATYTYTEGGTFRENGKLKSGLIGTNDDDVDRNVMETNIWNANDFVFKASNKSGGSSGVGLWLKMNPNENGDNNNKDVGSDVFTNRFVSENILKNYFVVRALSDPAASADGQNFVSYPSSNDRIYFRLFANNDEGDELDYTVHIELYHGIRCTFGEIPKTVKVPTWAGYEFLGYFTEANGGTKIFNADGTLTSNSGWGIAGDTRLYAHWKAYSYTIHFNGNGASSGSMSDIELSFDESRALPSNAFSANYTVTCDFLDSTLPSPSGVGYNTPDVVISGITYSFKHWSATGIPSQGTQPPYSNGQTVSRLSTTNNATVTLNAEWNVVSFTLPTVNESDRTGYSFDGWYTSESGGTRVGGSGETVNYKLSGDTTLYAHWTAYTVYTITFDEQNGSPVNMFDYSASQKKNEMTYSVSSGGVFNFDTDGECVDKNTSFIQQTLTGKYRKNDLTEANNAGDYIVTCTAPSGSVEKYWAAIVSGFDQNNDYAIFEFFKNNGYSSSDYLANELYFRVRKNRFEFVNGSSRDISYPSTVAFKMDENCTNFEMRWRTQSDNHIQVSNFNFRLSMVHGITGISPGVRPRDTNVPRKDGFEFLGYFTQPNGGGKQYYDEYGRACAVWTEEQDTTLYAHWGVKGFVLDLNAEIEKENGQVEKKYVPDNLTVDLYINGEKKQDDVSDSGGKWPFGATYLFNDLKVADGYTYTGWKDNNGTKYGADVPITGTIRDTTYFDGREGQEVVLCFQSSVSQIIFDEQNDAYPVNLFQSVERNDGDLYKYIADGVTYSYDGSRFHLLGKQETKTDYGVMNTRIWNCGDFIFKADNKNTDGGGLSNTWLFFILYEDANHSREPIKYRFETDGGYPFPQVLYRDTFSGDVPADVKDNKDVITHFHQYTGDNIWFKIWVDSNKDKVQDYSCDLALYHGIKAFYGTTPKSVRVPSQTGCTFKGYYDAPVGGTQYFDANGNPVRTWDKMGDVTLYGQWEGRPQRFDVKFKLRNGHDAAEVDSTSLDYNGVNYGSFDVRLSETGEGTDPEPVRGIKSYTNYSTPYNSILELENIITPQGFTFEKYYDSNGDEGKGTSSLGMRIPNKTSWIQLFIHRNSYIVKYKGNGSNVSGTVADTIHDWGINSPLASGSSLTNKYNLTFNYDGATTLNGAPENGLVQVDCGTAMRWSTKADPDDPTAEDYAFGRNVTDLTDEDYDFSRPFDPTIDNEEERSGIVILYARWDARSYSNFPTPEKLGYEFGGWYDNPAFTGTAYTNGTNYTVKKDTQFYAKWIRVPYKNIVKAYDFTTGVTADIISDTTLRDGGNLILGKELNGASVNTITASSNIKNPTTYISGDGYIAKIKEGTSGKNSQIEFMLDNDAETTETDFTIYYEYQFKANSLNQYITGSITFVPANNTYYEEYNFRKTNSVNPVDEDEYNIPSDWYEDWATVPNAAQSGPDYPVDGYSVKATTDLSGTFSNGKAYRAAVSEVIPSSKPLEFEFNGRGFDLYSACGDYASVLMVYVFSVTEEDGQKIYTPVVNAAVDTYLTDQNLTSEVQGMGRLMRQVPVYHFVSTNTNEYSPEDGVELESPTYLVQVYSVYIDGKNLIGCASPEEIVEVAAEEIEDAGLEVNEDIFEVKWVDENSVFNGGAGLATATDATSTDSERAMLGARPATRYGFVDGIRTLNPCNPAVEEYKFNYDSGYVSTEQNARFYNLKQFTRTNAETLNEYTGYTDKLYDEGEEPVGANPINEVYLAPYSSSNNSATSFKVEGFGTDVRRIMISARAVTGNPQIIVKSEGSDGTVINLTSGTSMYYDITDFITPDDNGDVTVIIAQSDSTDHSGYAGIENVKLIYSEEGLLALAGGNSHRVGLVGLSASEAKEVADSIDDINFAAAVSYNIVGASAKATIGWPVIIKNMMPVNPDDSDNPDSNGNGDADVPGNNGDSDVPGNDENGGKNDGGKDKQNPEGNKDNDGGKLGGIGIKILGYDSVRKVDYRSTVVFRSEVSAQPAGAVVKWYVDDKPVFTGDDFTLKEVRKVSVVQAKVVSEDGSTVLASSSKVTINPGTGLFQKIIAFFRSLFGRLPLVDDGAKLKK